MTLSLIVAASENNIIGVNGQLPWHLPNDMRYFKNTTWGMPVIMGRKTFESMASELPGRINIVITHNSNWKADNAIAVNSLSDALFVARDTDCKEAFVIGGGQVYKEAMQKADKLYITRVHAELQGDTYFADFDEERWKQVWSKDCFADERHAYDYTFQIWQRQ